jgi:hypothetical protein
MKKWLTVVPRPSCLNDLAKDRDVKTTTPYECTSCKKPSQVLSGGYCEHCLAVHVVKDWLKKDGVK